MNFRTIRYYFVEALKSLIKNRLMSIASILTVASCIFIVVVFYCLAVNIDFLLQQLENTFEITVFVEDEKSTEEVSALMERIQSLEHVINVRFNSALDVYNEERSKMEDPRIFDGISPDIYSREIIVEIEDPVYHDVVINELESLKNMGVSRTRHIKAIVDMVLSISKVVRWVLMIIIFALAVVSVVIITNTIRITVNSRRTEINIMKYVGATDWFIRWPFVIEGIFIGLFGSLIPAALCWVGYPYAVSAVLDMLPVISLVQFKSVSEIFVMLSPFCVFLGILIGAIGSASSIRNHLRV